MAAVDRTILIDELDNSLKWADIVFKEGPVGLDIAKNEEPDDRLPVLALTNLRQYEPEEIRLMVNTISSISAIRTIRYRQHGRERSAFGMVGTLIGLVVMLDNLGPNPEQIGGSLVALLTTLYGVLVAVSFFNQRPKYFRLENRCFRNMLMMETVMISESRSANHSR